jgi:putative ABC transport system permease protein
MAIADVPYAMSNKAFHTIGANVILPEEEYLKHSTDTGALYSILNTADDKVKDVEQFLQNYTTVEHTSLEYLSKQTYQDEFEGLVRMFWIVGGALCVVLALIGILNFLNTMITGMLARRQEFAMLEAVGMTGKQLKSMVMCEGIIYAFNTVIFSVTFGSLIGYGLIQAIAGQIWFFHYRFTLLPIALCIPFLILISSLIPRTIYRGMCRSSIVERLRIRE